MTTDTTERPLAVDADGHVLEPRDVWQRYMEPGLRERAIRIERDANGVEVLLVDGRPHLGLRGRLGALGGIGMDSEDLMTVGQRSYEDGCPPGGYDAQARLRVMDSELIDMALLYPTIGIAWEGLVRDPTLATAYTRAYNRWLVDFCSTDRRRLVPIAHICLMDPEGAVAEVGRARKDGCAGVYLSPDPPARGGRQLDDPSLAPFWETVQELEMPVAFHVVARTDQTLRQWLSPDDDPIGSVVFGFAFLALDVMVAFTSMMTRGLFEKYPRLKLAVLEAGSNWITAWLDRLDHKSEVMRAFSSLKLLPSEYFKRQCVISAEPDESLTGPVVEHLGDDYVVWASDYPHLDASFHVVQTIRERISGLPQESQAKVLGTNVLRFYGLTASRPQPEADTIDVNLHRVLLDNLPDAGRMEQRQGELRAMIAAVRPVLETMRDELRVGDPEVAAVVIVHALEAVTNAVVVELPHRLRDEVLVDEITALACRYLLK